MNVTKYPTEWRGGIPAGSITETPKGYRFTLMRDTVVSCLHYFDTMEKTIAFQYQTSEKFGLTKNKWRYIDENTIEMMTTRGKTTMFDSLDLEELAKYTWCYDGRYVVTRTAQKAAHMHKIILNLDRVGHDNGNGLDNRRCNLIDKSGKKRKLSSMLEIADEQEPEKEHFEIMDKMLKIIGFKDIQDTSTVKLYAGKNAQTVDNEEDVDWLEDNLKSIRKVFRCCSLTQPKQGWTKLKIAQILKRTGVLSIPDRTIRGKKYKNSNNREPDYYAITILKKEDDQSADESKMEESDEWEIVEEVKGTCAQRYLSTCGPIEIINSRDSINYIHHNGEWVPVSDFSFEKAIPAEVMRIKKEMKEEDSEIG
jgi:hypothetical protein